MSGRNKPTLRELHEELRALRKRVEDLEDLPELNPAIERNGTKPLIPWAKAKKSSRRDAVPARARSMG